MSLIFSFDSTKNKHYLYRGKDNPVPKKIPVLIHNGSAYDWHFIMKYLPEEIKGDFECLGENTEKYITFSIPIKKEVNNDDDGDKKKKRKKITHKLNFIDSYRFMPCK